MNTKISLLNHKHVTAYGKHLDNFLDKPINNFLFKISQTKMLKIKKN